MKSLDQIRNIKSTEESNQALNERASELVRRCDWEHLSKIEWANIKSQDEWNQAKDNSLKDYFSGKFLIDMIGGAKTIIRH